MHGWVDGWELRSRERETETLGSRGERERERESERLELGSKQKPEDFDVRGGHWS